MSVEKIGKIEAISLILLIMINELVLNVPNMIILPTSTGSTLNVIFVSILAIIFTFIICKLFKPFYGKDILDISEYVGGKTLKIIIGLLFILLFIFISSLCARYFANSLKVIYFNSSPLVFILLFLLIPALFINKFGIKAISGVNLIFIPLFIISLIFLLASSYSKFTVERLFPILGNGFNETFLIGSSNLFAFTGLAYLYFMPPLLKDAENFKSVTIISVIISSLFLIFSIITLLMIFPAVITTDEMLSIYLLARLIEFGHFLQRLDALFIFIWSIALISFLSLTFFYILRIFQKITKIENSKILALPLGFIILGNCLIIKNIGVAKYLARYFYKYGVLILVFVVSLIILIVANIKYKKNNNLYE